MLMAGAIHCSKVLVGVASKEPSRKPCPVTAHAASKMFYVTDGGLVCCLQAKSLGSDIQKARSSTNCCNTRSRLSCSYCLKLTQSGTSLHVTQMLA